MGKQNQPNNFVISQPQFLAASGVDVQIKDVHSEIVHDEMQSAKYYRVIVGESVHTKLIIYTRYVSPNTHNIIIETRLVGNIWIPKWHIGYHCQS